VRNVCFEKNVYVRLTLNKWTSYVDIEARFSTHETDGLTDRYFFVAPLVDGEEGDVAEKGDVEFAVCYRLSDVELWDNNEGKNYSFDYLNQ